MKPLRKLNCLVVVLCLIGTPKLFAASPAPLRASHAVVVSARSEASAAGLEILIKGGNAIDAAVATLLAISVVEPYSAGLGGGGFALIYDGKNPVPRALDFREHAPLAAHRDLYLDSHGQVIPNASTTGHRAVAVPGTVAGAAALLNAGGTMRFKQVSAPAIRLAEQGITVSAHLQNAIRARLDDLRKDPGARRVFLVDGQVPALGSKLLQKDLAETLRLLAQKGPQDFYRGDLAQAIVADMAENGGLISAADLQNYKVRWRKPEHWRYRGFDFYSMPLPSSGGLVMREIFSLLQQGDYASLPYHDPRRLHLYIEACRRAYADRASSMGDPAFLRRDAHFLVDKKRLQQRFASIHKNRATPSSRLGDQRLLPQKESLHTSHLIVVDKDGLAVSLTFTINTLFGSTVLVPGTGIVLNNEMDDFSVKPGQPNSFGLVGSEANAVGPAKIPLSSMSPTFVFKDKKMRLALGSPGGSTIITTVSQLALHILDDGMNVSQAVAAPRLHHQWLPDQVEMEPLGLDPLTRNALQKMGHHLHVRQPWGNAMIVERDQDGVLWAAADPRGEGSAQGM